MDTPASAATSRMVTRLIRCSSALAVDDPLSQPLAYGFVVRRENLFLPSGAGLTGTGPVAPTPAATGTHRPVAGARLADGLLHEWQHRSLTASLPLALRQLEDAGNLDNVRLAVRTPDRADADGHDVRPVPRNTVAPAPGSGYRGPVFMDSDLYKTLEAIGWELAHDPSPELAEFAADAVALLEKAQQPDGYLNSYVQVSLSLIHI